MSTLIQYSPLAMGVLILLSALFSSSEAALFYLDRSERRRLAEGNRAQRAAAALLADPDRLLTAVLFWNLVTNVAYFTIVSIAGLQMEREGHAARAGVFSFASLLALIFFSEMLPKSLAVLQARTWAASVSLPLAVLVRLLDPILPVFRAANLFSRRALWPKFRTEPYLRVIDLERAVELSTSDANLLEHEQKVLQSIVSLSSIRVDELMRPRTRFLSFRPPVSRADLGGRIPPSGYLLITEPDNDEVAKAIPLHDLASIPSENLERYADEVVYVPWSTTVAEALETMRKRHLPVAAAINEFGETIGILTLDDIVDTIFSNAPSRSERLLKRMPIRPVAPGVWHVTGMTSLWRLVRYFRVERPPSRSVTVAGVVQETLERLPYPGDECGWGPFRFRVLDVQESGQLLAELRLESGREGERP